MHGIEYLHYVIRQCFSQICVKFSTNNTSVALNSFLMYERKIFLICHFLCQQVFTKGSRRFQLWKGEMSLCSCIRLYPEMFSMCPYTLMHIGFVVPNLVSGNFWEVLFRGFEEICLMNFSWNFNVFIVKLTLFNFMFMVLCIADLYS